MFIKHISKYDVLKSLYDFNKLTLETYVYPSFFLAYSSRQTMRQTSTITIVFVFGAFERRVLLKLSLLLLESSLLNFSGSIFLNSDNNDLFSSMFVRSAPTVNSRVSWTVLLILHTSCHTGYGPQTGAEQHRVNHF